MKKIADIGGEWSFWTLTMPSMFHKLKDEETRARYSLKSIRKNWDKFMKFMKRKYGKFEYVRVFETHESGCLHIHFLANFWIPDKDYKTVYDASGKKDYSYSADMKKDAVYYGWGKMHSVENLPIGDFARTVGYVTKYMTKLSDVGRGEFGRIRRIQVSMGWAKWKKEGDTVNWELESGIFEQDIYSAMNAKLRYVDIATGE